LTDLGVDGRIIFKFILNKYDMRGALDSSGSGQGPVAGFCEVGNEPPGSKQMGEFVDQLLKKDSAPRICSKEITC
jgi:hypothetical protein